MCFASYLFGRVGPSPLSKPTSTTCHEQLAGANVTILGATRMVSQSGPWLSNESTVDGVLARGDAKIS